MDFIIAGIVVVLISVVSADKINKLEKKHEIEMKQLEYKHKVEMFSKQIEVTQANVQLAQEQCSRLREHKERDIELCNEALNKFDMMIEK